MKKFKIPSSYTTLFIIIVIIACLSFVIPAGQYEYTIDGQPIPGTYRTVPKNIQSIGDILLAPLEGFYNAVDIAVFILMIGGFLGITLKTGAIDAGISNIIIKLDGKEKYMIPILMIIFGLGGTTFGMTEETICFYPILIPVFISAGYDSITAVAVILLGAGIGVLASTVNPFATGIASGFAGISLGEGILIRLLLLIVLELVGILFVVKYAENVKKNPEFSLVYDMYSENKKHFSHNNSSESISFTAKRKTVIMLFCVTFLIMIYSVIPFSDMNIAFIPTLSWWFDKLSALFLFSAIIIGLYFNMNEDEIIDGFISGAADMLGVAFIIGISRGITIIMNNAMITDTLLHLGETALSKVSSTAFIILTYILYIPLSFFIPSTSGLATLTMPIMAPLGEFAGIKKHLIVTAYQAASGLVNIITPTSAVVMAALSIGRVPYGRWLKYVGRLLALIIIITIIILAIGSRM